MRHACLLLLASAGCAEPVDRPPPSRELADDCSLSVIEIPEAAGPVVLAVSSKSMVPVRAGDSVWLDVTVTNDDDRPVTLPHGAVPGIAATVHRKQHECWRELEVPPPPAPSTGDRLEHLVMPGTWRAFDYQLPLRPPSAGRYAVTVALASDRGVLRSGPIELDVAPP